MAEGELIAVEAMTLQRMPQQPAIIGSIDDWTGINNSVDRRKVQNRLNQRAYRRRKRSDNLNTQVASGNPQAKSQTMSIWQVFYTALGSQTPHPPDRTKLIAVADRAPFGHHDIERTMSDFKDWMQTRSMGSPSTDNLFVLVKFNVFRALVSNCKDLGIAVQDTLVDDSFSPFPNSSNSSLDLIHVPNALWPTNLQKQIPHHPWIDTLPISKMRDNLLEADEAYDGDSLCTALVGHGNDATTDTGMIIWGEPWDPDGWEVTKPFLQHWGWVLKGCHELAAATNSWRQRRGERPLDFEGYV
ncbi:hypothetical protein LTR84_002761 [Exophiala bonariae]|uniref:BZIP domain-containing protein n=1 Tax=Exophiala bonariae TaxID=1690606 RepID=A0AAV9N8L5_9EURO|nr:hypothetical protein LTR84_002761 [Exophiala bonariae]